MALARQLLDHRIGRREAEAAAASQHHGVRPARDVLTGHQGIELPSARGRAANLGRSRDSFGTEDHADAGHPGRVRAVADPEAGDFEAA
jgi:hypothetical protein